MFVPFFLIGSNLVSNSYVLSKSIMTKYLEFAFMETMVVLSKGSSSIALEQIPLDTSISLQIKRRKRTFLGEDVLTENTLVVRRSE